MDKHEYYEVEVPEGFTPMAQPTKDEDRLSNDKIQIKPLEEEDLHEFAATIYDAFPQVFWNKVEDNAQRPSLPERVRLFAKHWIAFHRMPGYHLIKAVHADTERIMGIANWMENGRHSIFPTSYANFPELTFPSSFVPCPFRDDLVRPLNLDQKMGWSDTDVVEMYGGHAPLWSQEYLKYETGRIKEMGDRSHWYLAPICVKKEYQARGVGKALMMYGIGRADASSPPMHCVLESLPNARPVYYHLGFEPTAEHGTSKDTQLVRPPLGKKESTHG